MVFQSNLRTPAAVAAAGLWLLLAACGGEAAADEAALPRVATATQETQEQGDTMQAQPVSAQKRDPAKTIEWRDGRFATVWDPGP